MINILLYVNDKEKLKELQNKIRCFCKEVKQSVKISSTYDFDITKNYINENSESIDLFFVDFSQKTQSLELAKLFHKKSPYSLWVFMNQDIQTLVQILHFRPSYYLTSPDDERLYSALKVMFFEHSLKLKTEFFTFKSEGEYIRVPFSKVTYIESQSKKVTLHLSNSTRKFDFNAKLDDLLENFPNNFVKCHQSYVVNMDFIKILNKKTQSISLFTGDNIFISRRKLGDVEQVYNSYVSKNSE